MLSNPADLTKCQACETAKPAAVETKKAALNPLLALSQKSGWTCDTCMLQNDSSVAKCSACETPKPGAGKPADKPASSTGLLYLPFISCFLHFLSLRRNELNLRISWSTNVVIIL